MSRDWTLDSQCAHVAHLFILSGGRGCGGRGRGGRGCATKMIVGSSQQRVRIRVRDEEG